MRRARGLRSIYALSALSLAATLSACGDSTDLEALDDPLLLDAAMVAADATVEEVRLWSGPLGFGDAATTSPAGVHGGSEPGRPGGHHGFDSELSGTRSVTFYDEADEEQTSYDPLTTASIHLVHEVEGTIERGTFRAEIARAREMTVSGLAGEETVRTWNGSGSSELLRSGVLTDGTERSHTAVGSVTFEDVVVPVPGSDPRYPLSGTITRTMTMTRTYAGGSETRTVEIVITFDGSEIATATVNGETMEIDLSTLDGRNPLRRHRDR